MSVSLTIDHPSLRCLTALIAVDLDEVGLICAAANFFTASATLSNTAAQARTYLCNSESLRRVQLHHAEISLWSGLLSICGTELCLWWLHGDGYNPTPYLAFREMLREESLNVTQSDMPHDLAHNPTPYFDFRETLPSSSANLWPSNT
ncbi:hypothetical protein M413DRAFT_21858 [Hebeloma cylindrosporum]|uniref:Uncharacterized protein n=1 Tax=Hebeloma cylindrosporum TaxID=76867 RepID=A0A0C3D0S5_HEBCY|nr:hypothetical protein M413DRAFT_21858 [Hebeloma cylindrosporum h7]